MEHSKNLNGRSSANIKNPVWKPGYKAWRAHCHLARRPKPTQSEKAALARAAKAMNPLHLEKTFNLFTPATLYRWYRELVREKCRYPRIQKKPGRPRISAELEALIVKLALENPQDGYDSLVGKLQTLGFQANSETVQNVLKRNGFPPSP